MNTGPDHDGESEPPTGHLPAADRLPATSRFPAQAPAGRRRPTAVIAGSVLVIVAVVAAVVVIVLTHRGSGGHAGQPAPAPPTTTTPATPSSPPSTTDTPAPQPGTGDWRPVANTAASGLTYSVPPDWADSRKARSTGRGEQWAGVAEFGRYPCPGGQYTRGFVAGGKPPTGGTTDLAGLARGYAKALAGYWYTDPRTEVRDPRPRTVDGHDAVQVTVAVSITPQNPRCDASTAEVVVLAVRLDRGIGMVAVVNDLTGGPAQPPCAPDGVIQQILGTVRVR